LRRHGGWLAAQDRAKALRRRGICGRDSEDDAADADLGKLTERVASRRRP